MESDRTLENPALLKQETHAPFGMRGASLDALKLLAAAFMVVDHVNFVCFEEAVSWMFYVGRGAYPLFAFIMACHLHRDAPLDRYLQRLVVFALLSQPLFVLVFQEDVLNILFTLALGAATARWFLEQAPWRQHLLCTLILSSVFLEEAIDFDLIGILLPALFLGLMRGERFARIWIGIMLVFLNLDAGDVWRLEHDQLLLQELSWDPLLIVAGTIALPWVSVALGRRMTGDRFLPRYSLYWFYPGHLMFFLIWRLMRGDLSLGLLSF